MARLTGSQIGQLQELILDAFSQQQFDELLLVKLNLHLDQIVPAGLDWRASVRAVIVAAEREGWTADLLRALAEARPRRNDIQTLVAQLLPPVEGVRQPAETAPTPKPEAPPPSPTPATPTKEPADRSAPEPQPPALERRVEEQPAVASTVSPPPFAPQPAPAAASKMWRWLLPLAGLLVLGVVLYLLLRPEPKATVAAPTAIPASIASPAAPTVAALAEAPTPATVETSAPEPTETPLPVSKDTPVAARIMSPDGPLWLLVPAGEFLMGSADNDADAESDEKPQHTVVLAAFSIMQTEVTNAMFERFVSATGHETTAETAGASEAFSVSTKAWEETADADWRHPSGPESDLTGLEDHPVVHVSWEDAAAYCAWAGGRLPTEAEWEKAARGPSTDSGDARKYPWGNPAPAGDLLNFADRNLDIDWADVNTDDGYQFTAPVGSYLKGASPYGALDMAGNVWEWTADWYDGAYYATGPSQNPTGPATGEERVLRGGAWDNDAGLVRSAVRLRTDPDFRSGYLGFRCARTP